MHKRWVVTAGLNLFCIFTLVAPAQAQKEEAAVKAAVSAQTEESAGAEKKPKDKPQPKRKPGSCEEDTDCRGRKVCFASSCTELFGRDSLLRVRLKDPVPGALLYIDNTPMGNIPWEGIIPSGPHGIEVKAPGYEPRKLLGESVAGRADTVLIELEPAAEETVEEETEPEEPDEPPEPEDEGWEPSEIGKYYAGLMGGLGFGGVSAGGESSSTVSVSGHLVGGMRLLQTPYWIDGGLHVGYETVKLKPYKWGKYQRLRISAAPRGYYPFRGDSIFAAAEVEVGVSISYQTHFLFAVRGGGSIFLSKLIEIRLNLIGLDFLLGKSIFVGYSSTIGLAVRFL